MAHGTITIAGESRTLEQADESWINQQINRRNNDDVPVCVVVALKTTGVDVRLATSACVITGGGGRLPSVREQQIFELWRTHGMTTNGFAGGQLISFLKQLRRLL
jgi:hypothetical protein